MPKVIIKRQELLPILQTNRQEHRRIFEAACIGYRKAAIAELEAMLTEAQAGKRIRRTVTLIEPMDQTRDYDRAIRMVELDTRNEIELTESEFARLVLDDWDWKAQFTHSNTQYLARD